MVSEQFGYERNGQRKEGEVALDQDEVHDKEEECMIQDYTRVTIYEWQVRKYSTILIRTLNKKSEKVKLENGLVDSSAHILK